MTGRMLVIDHRHLQSQEGFVLFVGEQIALSAMDPDLVVDRVLATARGYFTEFREGGLIEERARQNEIRIFLVTHKIVFVWWAYYAIYHERLDFCSLERQRLQHLSLIHI